MVFVGLCGGVCLLVFSVIVSVGGSVCGVGGGGWVGGACEGVVGGMCVCWCGCRLDPGAFGVLVLCGVRLVVVGCVLDFG